MVTEDQSAVVGFLASRSTHDGAIVEGIDTHSETGDVEGVPLLPLFLSCRAAVRAKTSATAATLQTDPPRRRELQEAARDYLVVWHERQTA
jgi:aminoglycoside phosphotransferase family enzyme